MKKDPSIINLTQHVASAEQVEAGVFEPALKADIQELLTFSSPPNKEEIRRRACALADCAFGCSQAMIGGALWLMGPLTQELRDRGIVPLFAFSERVSIDKPDGTKISVFKHVGFVEAA